MDVHQHKHTGGHHKNWKEYVSEFLMLFLAVFCGFIAENIREHYVEKSREKEYVQSMIDDLKRDTLQLHQASRVNGKIVKAADSLLYYLRAERSDSAKKKIYIFGGYFAGSVLYENSNGTLTQLKNAGGLRLIKDTAAVNGIVAYDQFNELLRKDGLAYYSQTMAIIDLLGEVLDFSIAKPQLLPKNAAGTPAYFIKNDPDKLRVLYNKCYMQQRIISGYAGYLDKQYADATKLLALLQKNYHLGSTSAADTTSIKNNSYHKDTINPPKK